MNTAILLALLAAAPASTTWVKAGRLIDGTGAAPRSDVVIAIDGERITSVTPAASTRIPEGATVVDLSKATVLPGLIDCHTHLAARADRYEEIQ